MQGGVGPAGGRSLWAAAANAGGWEGGEPRFGGWGCVAAAAVAADGRWGEGAAAKMGKGGWTAVVWSIRETRTGGLSLRMKSLRLNLRCPQGARSLALTGKLAGGLSWAAPAAAVCPRSLSQATNAWRIRVVGHTHTHMCVCVCVCERARARVCVRACVPYPRPRASNSLVASCVGGGSPGVYERGRGEGEGGGGKRERRGQRLAGAHRAKTAAVPLAAL